MKQNTLKFLTVSAALALVIGGTAYYVRSNSDDNPQPEYDGPVAESIDDSQATTPEPAPTQDEQATEEESTPPQTTVVVDELEVPDGLSFPVQTNHFTIEEIKGNTYQITLLAILNRPEQYQEYQANLAQFKEEALTYMGDNGLVNEQTKINYIPEEAKDL